MVPATHERRLALPDRAAALEETAKVKNPTCVGILDGEAV